MLALKMNYAQIFLFQGTTENIIYGLTFNILTWIVLPSELISSSALKHDFDVDAFVSCI